MDIFLKENRKNAAACITAIAACVIIIVNSEIAVLSAKKAISIWLSDVVPALLPFFICVNYLEMSGVINYLPGNIFPFVMSVLSGYPMGAKIVGDLSRNGSIDLREAKRLAGFCSTSGPVFIIGAVGTGMLGSQTAGIITAAAHYLGALFNCILFSVVYRKRGCYKNVCGGGVCENRGGQFSESIFSAFRSVGIILVYIILFMFLCDLLNVARVFDVIDSPSGMCLARGFFEMTIGCSSIKDAGLTDAQSCIIASMIISWGGLSIIGQSASMLSGTGISVFFIVLSKLLHCIFAGIIALFMSGIML